MEEVCWGRGLPETGLLEVGSATTAREEHGVAYDSLQDVAARAGVSFQTASKVLNVQTHAASRATGERILAAARELGYVPNALARNLVRQGSTTIGVLSDDFADIS